MWRRQREPHCLYGTVLTSGAASLVGLTYAKLTAHLAMPR